MNGEPSLSDDPFSPAVLDEATELRALTRALELAKGFKLIFARCNQADQRRSLVEKVHGELPSLNIQEIQFIEPITHLLDALREKVQRPVPDGVFVYGLEYSFPSAAEAHLSPLVANLNASRNSFPEVINCPLVLWVPEFVLNAIMLGAPDFFSIRSGVYFFAASPSETVGLAQSLVGDYSAVGSLTLKEKLERVKAIESLLTDYQSLPEGKRDSLAELRLRLRLADLYDLLGVYESAKAWYEKSLEQAQELENLEGQSVAYSGLGIVYRNLGELPQAKEMFERGLEISRATGDRLGEAMDLRNLGNVSFSLGGWEDARTFYERSLEIIKTLGDKAQEGQALINLANVYQKEGNFLEGEELAKNALILTAEAGDRMNEQVGLQALGVLYMKQGRLSEAEEANQKSLQIALELGLAPGTWMTLINLSILRELQGDYAGAQDLQDQAVKIMDRIRAKGLPAALSRLEQLRRKALEQQDVQKQLA